MPTKRMSSFKFYILRHVLYSVNKRQRIPKGQSKKNNPEKLATQGTQDEENSCRSEIPLIHPKRENM